MVIDESSNDLNQKRPYSTSSLAQNRRSTVGFIKSKPPIGSSNEPNKSTSQLPSTDPSTSGMKNYTRKSQSYLRESKSRVETRFWESSYSRKTPSMRRSSSAKLVRDLSRSPTPEQRKQPSPMFLNYSKLLAIEASFDCNQLGDLNSTNESVPDVLGDDGIKLNALKFEEPLDNEIPAFEAHWLELPDELWLKILSFMKQSDLVNIGRTCKHLNQLYTDSSLCKKRKP